MTMRLLASGSHWLRSGGTIMNDYEKDATKVGQLVYLLGICPKSYVIRTIGEDPRSLGAIRLIVIDHFEQAVVLYTYPQEICDRTIEGTIIGTTRFTYRHICGILYEGKRD